MLEDVIADLRGIILAAGGGTRMWPFGLVSPIQILTKSLNRYMGIPLAQIQAYLFAGAGIKEVDVIGRGQENRGPMGERLDAGDSHIYNLSFEFTHPMFDKDNTGSADAIIGHIQRSQSFNHSYIVANDNYFGIDINRVLDLHKKSGSVVTVLSYEVPALETIGTYGIMLKDEHGRIIKWAEKPQTANKLREFRGMELVFDSSYIDDLKDVRISINAGAYFVDDKKLVALAEQEWVVKGRKISFDMATHFIKGLVERGEQVSVVSVDHWIDFGLPKNFLDGIQQLLAGRVPVVFDMLAESKSYVYWDGENLIEPERGYNYSTNQNHIWVHKATLKMDAQGKRHRRSIPGVTLDERIKSGEVKLEGNVYLGRGVVVQNNVRISNSNIDKLCYIGENSFIDGSYVSEESKIRGGTIKNSMLSKNVTINASGGENDVVIEDLSIVGVGTIVPPKVHLKNSRVWPGYQFKDRKRFEYTNQDLTPSLFRRLILWSQYSPEREREGFLYKLIYKLEKVFG